MSKDLSTCPKHWQNQHYKNTSKNNKHFHIDIAILPVWLIEVTFLAAFLHILSDIEKSKKKELELFFSFC